MPRSGSDWELPRVVRSWTGTDWQLNGSWTLVCVSVAAGVTIGAALAVNPLKARRLLACGISASLLALGFVIHDLIICSVPKTGFAGQGCPNPIGMDYGIPLALTACVVSVILRVYALAFRIGP